MALVYIYIRNPAVTKMANHIAWNTLAACMNLGFEYFVACPCKPGNAIQVAAQLPI